MIIGVITNVGLAKSILAQANNGWRIVPKGFAVSDDEVAVVDSSGFPDWGGTEGKIIGDKILPTESTGFYYECTTAGTTGGTEPEWPITQDDTIADGTVVWTARTFFDAVAAEPRNFVTWQASTAFTTDDSAWPTVKNGFYYECTTAGTTGGSEPTFPTTRGDTVADGTVIWTCRGLWYDLDYPSVGDGLISARTVVDENTIIFECVVPPSIAIENKDAKEIFLFAELMYVLTGDQDDGVTAAAGSIFTDANATFLADGVKAGDSLVLKSGSDIGTYRIISVDDEDQVTIDGTFTTGGEGSIEYEIYEIFLLATGQPNTTVVYDFEGSIKFRLAISIANVDIESTYDFVYTQAVEVGDHNADINAHPEIQSRLELFGIFTQGTTDLDFEYRGQHVDEDATFDAGVADKNAVYKNADGKYYKAIADGTDKANVVGIADLTNSVVISGSGFVDTGLTFTTDGAKVYLSDTTPGLVTETVTNTLLGFVVVKADGIILLGTTGGGGGILSVSESFTHEDDLYHTWLSKASFLEVKFDKFGDPGTVTAVGATYNSTEHRYDGEIGDTIASDELLPDASTRYRFEINAEVTAGTVVTAEYNIGAGWVSANLNEVVTIEAGFTTLKVKFTWTADGAVNSFGVLFNETGFIFQTDTRMSEVYTVPADSASPNVITLPNNALYTVDGKSLEVYFRGVRLINGIDFTEDSNSQITLNEDVSKDDLILFTEKIGYVDTSIDNKIRLDLEHNPDGSHNREGYILIRDEKADGVDGGTFTLGAWRTRDLTVKVVDTGGDAVLAANQVTLQPGTYRFKASAPGHHVGLHQVRLRNITDVLTIAMGTSENATSSAVDLVSTTSFVKGKFTIAVTKVVELQHRSSATESGTGFGVSAGWGEGEVEVYAEIELWKELD